MRGLWKPEYLFRPRQAVRRLRQSFRSLPSGPVRVDMPWGTSLWIDPRETVGRGIWHLGVYDLAVSETLWRLSDPGEIAVDAGANLGYMTSLLAARLGPRGRVLAFEPHPLLAERLQRNIQGWNRTATARVDVYDAALSETAGAALLVVPDGFDENQGISYLSSDGDVEVRAMTLDEALSGRSLGVLKLDVEGHELPALRGAVESLGERRIRDIVYEAHGARAGTLSEFLSGHGYNVYRLSRGFLKPRLDGPSRGTRAPDWMPPGYLATLDPVRAQRRLLRVGWQVLRSRAF